MMVDKVSATQNSAVFFLLCSKNYLNFPVFVASVELHPSGFASWVKQTLFGNSTQTVGLQQNHLELLKKATSLNTLLLSRGSNDAMWAKIKSKISYMDVHVTCAIISAAADLLSGLQGYNHTRGHCCNFKGKEDQ